MTIETGASRTAQLLGRLLSTVDMSSTAATRFASAENLLAAQLEIDPALVRGTFVSEPKMVSPRLSTPGIVRARPALVLAAMGADADFDRAISAIQRKMLKDGHLRTVLVARPDGPAWDFPVALTRAGERVASQLADHFSAISIVTVADPDAPVRIGGSTGGGTAHSRPRAGTIVVDDNIRRLLRHTMATSRAVVLIGPPGTGKTTLVGDTLQDLADDPARYRLTRSPEWGEPVTPDESWTASEILGGPTLVKGEIVFRGGHVLRAIQDDHHLFLDEANRADLDKIMGGLLTWLSGNETVIGRLTEAAGSPLVTIGWNDGPESRVVNENLLNDPMATPQDDDGPVRYLAGGEWRLVATYNAVDAQRVFRFGEALGRRFAKVPVPPPDLVAASELITARCTDLDLDPEVAVRVMALYEAHLDAEETVLGPAPFLDVLPYLKSVAQSGDLDLTDTAQAENAVAEGYVSQMGLNLARLEEDELDRLGDRIVNAGAFGADAWTWLRSLLPALRG